MIVTLELSEREFTTLVRVLRDQFWYFYNRGQYVEALDLHNTILKVRGEPLLEDECIDKLVESASGILKSQS